MCQADSAIAMFEQEVGPMSTLLRLGLSNVEQVLTVTLEIKTFFRQSCPKLSCKVSSFRRNKFPPFLLKNHLISEPLVEVWGWKSVTNYVLEWIGFNFYYYNCLRLHPKMSTGMIKEDECTYWKVALSQKVFHFGSNLKKKGAKSLSWEHY